MENPCRNIVPPPKSARSIVTPSAFDESFRSPKSLISGNALRSMRSEPLAKSVMVSAPLPGANSNMSSSLVPAGVLSPALSVIRLCSVTSALPYALTGRALRATAAAGDAALTGVLPPETDNQLKPRYSLTEPSQQSAVCRSVFRSAPSAIHGIDRFACRSSSKRRARGLHGDEAVDEDAEQLDPPIVRELLEGGAEGGVRRDGAPHRCAPGDSASISSRWSLWMRMTVWRTSKAPAATSPNSCSPQPGRPAGRSLTSDRVRVGGVEVRPDPVEYRGPDEINGLLARNPVARLASYRLKRRGRRRMSPLTPQERQSGYAASRFPSLFSLP